MKHKVVLVAFPFDDLSGSKVRPAVCLTDAIGPHRHVVLAFVTSRVPPEPLETDLVIDTEDPDFALTGLHVSSALQLHRLLTANAGLIQRELGELSPAFQAKLAERLRRLFGL
jgi:mRNA interferase MazF